MQKIPDNSTFSLANIKRQLKPLCYKDGKTVRSYQQFYRLFYFIRLLKYSTQEQLKSIKFSGNSKVATKDILLKLVDLGLIDKINNSGDIFIPNETTDKIVQAVAYKTSGYFKLFANLPKGKDAVNEIKNTEIFVQALKMKYYHFLLFPEFGYVYPDALLVQKDGDRYKLTFLEIEIKQSNWSERLDRMRENYLKLSNDIAVYEYWKDIAEKVNLKVPEINDFKFSVSIICDTERDWEEGFEFKKSLN